jgi:hypothetical protein
MELNDYKVTFFKQPLFGFWSYEIKRPDKRILRPMVVMGFGGSQGRANAEAAALRQIKADMATETLSGQELADKLNSTE